MCQERALQISREIRCLLVDLSSGEVTRSSREAEFLGGRGENYRHLLEQRDLAAMDALSPDAPMVWAAGPLVRAGFPGASRIHVAAKSPLTGGVGAGSAGSDFAGRMAGCGVDQVILRGRAASPVYVAVTPDGVEIRDARELWGRRVSETDAEIRRIEREGCSTAIIGPAGENRVLSASILFDARRAVGRCGLGAVMGAKNLKALVVCCQMPHLLPQAQQRAKEFHEVLLASRELQEIRDMGTMRVSPAAVEPIRNFRAGRVPEAMRENLHGRSFLPYVESVYGCTGCPVQCGRIMRATWDREGATEVVTSTGLHANSVTDFGTRLGIGDPKAVIAAHGLCNDLGLDIDNASCAVAWSMEAVERGLLPKSWLSGLDLRWGETDAVLELLQHIAERRGLGEVLAEGTCAAARTVGRGSEEFCVAVNGQELQEAVRPFWGWALGIMVSERSGTHTRGAPVLELGGSVPAPIAQRAGVPEADIDEGSGLPAGDPTGKAKVVCYYERLHALLDSLGECYFCSDWMDPELPGLQSYGEVIGDVLGVRDLRETPGWVGERIVVLGRLLAIHLANRNRADDQPPARVRDESIETGQRLDPDRWSKLLDQYYEEHEWDRETGRPSLQTLKKLDLQRFAWVIEAADATGRLSK